MDETLIVTIINFQYVYLYNLIISYKLGILQNPWILKILPD